MSTGNLVTVIGEVLETEYLDPKEGLGLGLAWRSVVIITRASDL